MRAGAVAAFALAVALCTLTPAFAAFRPGDIIVAGLIQSGPFSFSGKIRQFAPDGSLLQEFYSIDDGFTRDLKFSPQGVLHTALGPSILRFSNDGSQLVPLTASPSSFSFYSLAFARSGDLFATTAFGSVVRFARDGTQQSVDSLGTGTSQGADLSPDQCTLYHARLPSPSVGRFDVCTHAILSPLPIALAGGQQTLLVLPDGTFLVSMVPPAMYHVRQDGTLLQLYTTHAIAYARDTDPNFVWVSTHGGLAKFDLRNDVFAAGPFETGLSITGIAIVGADVQTIPSASPLLLALLALVLASFAIIRLRTL